MKKKLQDLAQLKSGNETKQRLKSEQILMVRTCIWTITAQATQLIQKLIGSSPSKWSRAAHWSGRNCFLTLITTTASSFGLGAV